MQTRTAVRITVGMARLLFALACAGHAVGCAPRLIQIEQNALLPVPVGPRISGPVGKAQSVHLQGDLATGFVPTPTAPRRSQDLAGHSAVFEFMRGALSYSTSDTVEVSVWADYGYKGLSRPSVVGLDPNELGDAHALWGGLSLRKLWPTSFGGVRSSWDVGAGRVPWSRIVRITDEVLVQGNSAPLTSNPLAGSTLPNFDDGMWFRFRDGYMRRGVATAFRAAWFADLSFTVSEDINIHSGFGLQLVPYAPSFVQVTFPCGERATPAERDQTCATDRDVDIFHVAMLKTLTAGLDWTRGVMTWTVDFFGHVGDGQTGAATAPVGMVMGVRY